MQYVNRALIVEDEDSIRKLLSIMFSMRGIQCDLARDGKDGLERIKTRTMDNESYKVVLTDLAMPNLDGIALIEQIGEMIGKKEILRPEIYVLSGGHDRTRELYNLQNSGLIRNTFQKPVSLVQIVEEIATACNYL